LIPTGRLRVRIAVHGNRRIAWPPDSGEFSPASWAMIGLPPVVAGDGRV